MRSDGEREVKPVCAVLNNTCSVLITNPARTHRSRANITTALIPHTPTHTYTQTDTVRQTDTHTALLNTLCCSDTLIICVL